MLPGWVASSRVIIESAALKLETSSRCRLTFPEVHGLLYHPWDQTNRGILSLREIRLYHLVPLRLSDRVHLKEI